MTENEKWYDEEIAPALAAIGNQLQDRGMHFVLVVEYDPDERGMTVKVGEDAGLAMKMLRHCAKTGTNLDGYVLGLLKWANRNGIDFSGTLVGRALLGESKDE